MPKQLQDKGTGTASTVIINSEWCGKSGKCAQTRDNETSYENARHEREKEDAWKNFENGCNCGHIVGQGNQRPSREVFGSDRSYGGGDCVKKGTKRTVNGPVPWWEPSGAPGCGGPLPQLMADLLNALDAEEDRHGDEMTQIQARYCSCLRSKNCPSGSGPCTPTYTPGSGPMKEGGTKGTSVTQQFATNKLNKDDYYSIGVSVYNDYVKFIEDPYMSSLLFGESQ